MPVIEVLNSEHQQTKIDLQRTLAEPEGGPLYFRGWTEIGQQEIEVTDKSSGGTVHPCVQNKKHTVCAVCHDQSTHTGDIFFNTNVERLQQGSRNDCSYCTALLDAIESFNKGAQFDLEQVAVLVLSDDPHKLDLRTLSVIFWELEDVGRTQDQLAKVDIFRIAGT